MEACLGLRSAPQSGARGEDAPLSTARRERIGHYERAYETVADEEGAYIKLHNLSSKVSANQVFGRMSTRVLPYLTALHIRERCAGRPRPVSSRRRRVPLQSDGHHPC